jgi:hypothetical protein
MTKSESWMIVSNFSAWSMRTDFGFLGDNFDEDVGDSHGKPDQQSA